MVLAPTWCRVTQEPVAQGTGLGVPQNSQELLQEPSCGSAPSTHGQGEKHRLGRGCGLASTGLVAAEPVLGLSPAHGPSAQVLHSAGCPCQLHGEAMSNVRSLLMAHPAPGRARGTYASLGEHWCKSPARSLEVVQAQPTSLESGGGGQGQLSSWGSQAFLSQTGEPHSHVLLCFAGLHTMGISPSFGSAHAAVYHPGHFHPLLPPAWGCPVAASSLAEHEPYHLGLNRVPISLEICSRLAAAAGRCPGAVFLP